MPKISEAAEEEAMILMTSKDKNKPEKCLIDNLPPSLKAVISFPASIWSFKFPKETEVSVEPLTELIVCCSRANRA